MNGVNEFLDSLTEKQLDVLSCVIFGLSYKSIGRTLGISDRTVGVHIHEILQRSSIPSKDELIKYLSLPENADYYDELKERYNAIVLQSTHTPKYTINWKICTTAFIIVSVLIIASLYHTLNKAEVSLQSIGNSTYLLKRKNIIKQMTSCNNHVIILAGQGGAGKTTLAREYTRNLNRSIKYEINAESKSSMKAELAGLARTLSATPKDIETKNIIESISDEKEKLRHLSVFLYEKLREQKNWCLLLDNLENANIISSVYLDNIFALNNGTVVITTRNKGVYSCFPTAKLIPIGKLCEKEKIKLFCKITNRPLSKIIEKNLLEIPSYPLDVSCCAHYVKNTGISLPAYIQKMDKMDQAFWNRNRKILSDNTSYTESRCSIVISSIEEILQKDKDLRKTKALLAISILDSQKISTYLLTKILGRHSADESIYDFQKYGLLDTSDGSNFTTHRVTQTIMRHYCLQHIPKDIIDKFISEICYVVCKEKNNDKITPHLKSIIVNLEERIPLPDKVQLRIALIHLIQQYGRAPVRAVKYIKEAIKDGKSIVDPYEMVRLQLEGAKLCISAGRNKEALEFLQNDLEKLPFNQEYLFSYINYYTLWGILYMSTRHPEEADNNFDKAIKLLEKIKENSDLRKITEAAIYSAKGINYLRLHIHKEKMHEAVKMMKYSVSLVDGINTSKAIDVLVNTKIRLASAYNSLGVHNEAMKMCEEAEPLLDKMKKKNNNYYSTKGLLYVEHGHALLRKREFKKAVYYLQRSKELFDQLVIYDYYSRERVQEAEALISLGKYDEAYQDCTEVITNGKTDNDFNEMFFYRAHYTAGVIQYKKHHQHQALKHFRDFTIGMKKFCRYFLNKQQYKDLENMHAFDVVTDEKNIKTCFKNALEIFKRVCYKNSRFIKDYALKFFEECD